VAADLEWSCGQPGKENRSGLKVWPFSAEELGELELLIKSGGMAMKQTRGTDRVELHQSRASVERRRLTRTRVSFGLMYSRVSGDDVLIGDGTVVDLSEGGLGIRGNIPVQAGMELTLFLYLPDREEPLFVLEATVTRNTGTLFGVELNELSLRDSDRLRSFLHAQSVGQA
jgi:hypothetical protein